MNNMVQTQIVLTIDGAAQDPDTARNVDMILYFLSMQSREEIQVEIREVRKVDESEVPCEPSMFFGTKWR